MIKSKLFIQKHKKYIIAFVVFVIFIIISIFLYNYVKQKSDRNIQSGINYKKTLHNNLPKLNGTDTYSIFFWLRVDDWTYHLNKKKHILTRGEIDLKKQKCFPAIYLTELKNNMVIYISTHDKVEQILIENIPVKKWVNICINVFNKIVVIYFNSKLLRTLNLSAPAVIYPYDLHICANGGFNGYISSVSTRDDNLKQENIINNYNKGPGFIPDSDDFKTDIEEKKCPEIENSFYSNHYEEIA